MGRARIYAKKLFDTTYADKREHLTKNVYYQSFLNALDKQEESIRLKLSSLLKEISEVDIELGFCKRFVESNQIQIRIRIRFRFDSDS